MPTARDDRDRDVATALPPTLFYDFGPLTLAPLIERILASRGNYS
jgi:hypothetical protein